MVIVQLVGGLGNQMFQYAAACRLAHARKTEIKLDISWFATHSHRKYELNYFQIEERFASDKDLALFTKWPRTIAGRAVRRLIWELFPSKRCVVLEEDDFHFNPQVLEAPNNTYLIGYWQNEKYFSDVASLIRQGFQLRTPVHSDIEKRIVSTPNAVGVTVRRGDFFHSPIHPICSLEYYSECRKVLPVKDPHFFVFSDDDEWVADNFRLRPMTQVRQSVPHIDLILLSRCRHHIMANSTFSWWGAWLCPYQDKVVIGPTRWVNHMETSELMPPEWLCVTDPKV